MVAGWLAGGAPFQTHENLEHLHCHPPLPKCPTYQTALFFPKPLSPKPQQTAGDALFQTHENLEHLAMMEAVLGPIPPQLASSAAEGVRDLFRRCVSTDLVLVQGWLVRGPIPPQLAAAAAEGVHDLFRRCAMMDLAGGWCEGWL